MLNHLAPFALTLGANAIFAAAAFKIGKTFPKQANRIGFLVFGVTLLYGLFVLGPIHASGTFGDMFWFIIAYGVIILVSICIYNHRFDLSKGLDKNRK